MTDEEAYRFSLVAAKEVLAEMIHQQPEQRDMLNDRLAAVQRLQDRFAATKETTHA